MSDEIKINRATWHDIDAVATLFDAYRLFYGKTSAPEEAKTFLRERVRENESIIYVASQQDVITGFTQMYPLFSSTRMKRYWLLNDLFVTESFRGRGISRALLERAKVHCRDSGACGFMLETAKANHIANALYVKEGLIRDQDHHYYTWDIA